MQSISISVESNFAIPTILNLMTLVFSAGKFSAHNVRLPVFDGLSVLVLDQIVVGEDLICDWDAPFFSFLGAFTDFTSFQSGDDRLVDCDRG
jgi:hypothetical protein